MQERIEAYLSGSLSEEEKANFELALERDPALKEALTAELAVRVGAFAAGVQDQKAQLIKRYHEQGPKKQLSGAIRPLYLVAAAAVVALLISLWVLVPRTPSSVQDLYASYYERPVASVMRDGKGFESY
ncbi:MAG: hypothetical protein AAFP02_21450, partial [Bacteroidota bacterium]